MNRSGGRRRWEPAAFLLVTMLGLVPVLSVQELPLQDLPQHLTKLRVLVDHDRPELRLGEFYRVEWSPTPYVSFYAFGATLGGWIGIEAAARVWVAIYVLAFPLAVRVWLREAGRGRQPLSWLAIPLVFHPFYYLGFTNLLMGLPLFFLGLALLCRRLRGAGGRPGLAGAAAVALLLYLTHPFVFLLFGFTSAALVVAAGGPPRRWPGQGAFLLPAALAFGLWALHLVGTGAFEAPPEEARGVLWYGPAVTLGYVARFVPGPYAWPGREIAALAWLVALLSLVLLGRRRPPEPPGEGIPTGRLAAVAGAVAGLVLILPFKFTYANYINLRPLPFLLPLLLACLPPRLLRGAAPKMVAGALAGAVIAVATFHHLRFQAELRPLEEIIAEMEPGLRVLPLVFDLDGATFDDRFLDPLLHVAAYYHARKGGAGPYFQALTLFPVRLREGVSLPAPSEYAPGRFRWSVHAPHYDAFLAYRPDRRVRRELFHNGRLAAASRGWFLFRKRPGP